MQIQRLLVGVTVVNLALLMFLVVQVARVEADSVAPVLRGRMLEIVDERGRVRASIKVQPADPTVTMPNGRTVPDNVILRLSDPNGRPSVKIGTSEYGGGLGLVGENDATYVVLQADLSETSLKLKNKDGRLRLITP
jgi:hypothetical protein